MKSKIGEIILILGVLLFLFGAIAMFVSHLPQSMLQAMVALALICVGVGLSLKKRGKK